MREAPDGLCPSGAFIVSRYGGAAGVPPLDMEKPLWLSPKRFLVETRGMEPLTS